MNAEKFFSEYTLYIDCCSLLTEGGRAFLINTLLPLCEQKNKSLKVLENVRIKLKNMLRSQDVRESAEGALDVLDAFEQKLLLEEVFFPQQVHADRAFIPILFEEMQNQNICLITEDAALAKDLILKIKTINSAVSKYDLQCVRIGDSLPKVWDAFSFGTFDTPQHHPARATVARRSSSVMPETGETLKKYFNRKLLITFVVDNCAEMAGEKIEAFKNSFKVFVDKFIHNEIKGCVEFSLIMYEDFNPRVLKRFGDDFINFDAIRAKKIPFLGKSINKALDDIKSRRLVLQREGQELHKSWLLIMTDGKSFDEINDSVVRLKEMDKAGELIFMPFMMSDKEVPESLASLDKTKKMMKIIDDRFDCFFNWAIEAATKRITLDKSFKFQKSDFSGWAKL